MRHVNDKHLINSNFSYKRICLKKKGFLFWANVEEILDFIKCLSITWRSNYRFLVYCFVYYFDLLKEMGSTQLQLAGMMPWYVAMAFVMMEFVLIRTDRLSMFYYNSLKKENIIKIVFTQIKIFDKLMFLPISFCLGVSIIAGCELKAEL